MKENVAKFHKLIENQFQYGGKKYAFTGEKESTDILFDEFGKAWLFGTMAKYTFRFSNLERERDILKIATYLFILWLKRGFFLDPNGLKNDALNTTPDIKEGNFPVFIERMEKIWKNSKTYELESYENNVLFDIAKKTFSSWNKMEWSEITELRIAQVYYIMFFVWNKKYLTLEKHDEDILNESVK